MTVQKFRELLRTVRLNLVTLAAEPRHPGG